MAALFLDTTSVAIVAQAVQAADAEKLWALGPALCPDCLRGGVWPFVLAPVAISKAGENFFLCLWWHLTSARQNLGDIGT